MKFFLSILLIAFCAGPAMAREVVTSKHDPYVELWLPPDFQSGEGPWPLIIFSHGFAACAKQADFLTSYLAEQGYIVAAPDHADATPCKTAKSYVAASDFTDKVPEVPYREPMQWADQNYTSRRDDIIFTLTSVLSDPRFKGVVDEDNIGLIGHSLGGYTALGLAGGWPSWADKRFKAVFATSPYANPYIVQKNLGKLSVPVFYVGGTLDNPTTPVIKKMAWPQTAAPKYYLEIEGGGHSSFTEKDARFHDLISRQALAFFDRYLKDKNAAINPGKIKGVAEYREETGSSAP